MELITWGTHFHVIDSYDSNAGTYPTFKQAQRVARQMRREEDIGAYPQGCHRQYCRWPDDPDVQLIEKGR